jgi:hypothetical protein
MEYSMRYLIIATGTALSIFLAVGAHAAEQISNGGFESPAFSASSSQTTDNWTLTQRFSMIGNVARLRNRYSISSGYIGDKIAYMQRNGTLTQSFAATESGTLHISWLESSGLSETSQTPLGQKSYSVLFDNVSVGSFTSINGQTFMARSVDVQGIIGGSNHTLAFAAAGNSSEAVFLDQVSANITAPVAAVPEPETWALMATGMGLMGVLLRRRKRPASPTCLAAC